MIRNKINRKQLIVSLVFLFCSVATAFAYNEEYPPYKFGNEFKNYFKLQNLSGGKPIYEDLDYHYKAKKGSFELIKTNPENYFSNDSLIIKINNKTILNDKVHWHITGFLKADIDKNGFDDYIVISNSVGNGLFGFAFGKIYIFLGKPDGSYETIYFKSVYPNENDFVDINNDGKSEIIIGGLEYINEHHYWSYNIYEIRDYKLVNVDAKFNDFPKFIWLTNNRNDKNTTRLTQEEKQRCVEKKDKSINYGIIKSED